MACSHYFMLPASWDGAGDSRPFDVQENTHRHQICRRRAHRHSTSRLVLHGCCDVKFQPSSQKTIRVLHVLW